MNAFLSYLALFVAGQSLFLFVIILRVSPIGRTSNRLLAAFILVKFCKFMLFFFGFGSISLPPHVFLFQNLAFTTGPLLYLYVLSLVSEGFIWQRRYLWHFFPAIVATVTSLLVYDVTSTGAQRAFLISADDPQYLYRSIHIAVGALWFLAYLLLARHLLPAYEQRIRETYSSIEALTLDWLRRILIVALLAYTLIAVLDVAGLVFGLENEPRRLLELGCYIVLFYVIAINGLRRGLLLEGVTDNAAASSAPAPAPVSAEVATEREAAATEPRKYQRSVLDKSTSRQIFQLANAVMQQQEPYLDSDFKLPQLADLVGVSIHDLSQAINTEGKTYYDYVNGYRAEKAKGLIPDPQYRRLAMLDIALQAGFSSKSTFYKHFRRCYEQTPAEYRKSLSG
ncbi:MAG: helix-turn-helix transcriptional regulator [Gammaproteobacteria bacterium]|nr:helix-turn-helix transcriptional regulator [Gammaproteobacteria bacterium]